MAENELTPASCTSDGRNTEDLPVNVVRNSPQPLSTAAELELGDTRESLSPTETSITPGLIDPIEDKGGPPDVTSDTSLLPTNIGVRILLKEIDSLKHRVEVVKTVVEPLKRYDGVAGGGSPESIRQNNIQPAATPHNGAGMTHELKQSIKESAELIRTINGDFSRLGEKLNEWVPVVDKKV